MNRVLVRITALLALSCCFVYSLPAYGDECPYVVTPDDERLEKDADLSFSGLVHTARMSSEGTLEGSDLRAKMVSILLVKLEIETRLPVEARTYLQDVLGVVQLAMGEGESSAHLLQLDAFKTELGSATWVDNVAHPADYAWEVASDRLEVRIPLSLDDSEWTCESLKRFVSYLDVAREIISEEQAPYWASLHASLSTYVNQWDALFEGGYSQYPWELWSNGKNQDLSAWGPNRNQWILLHPTAGFVVGNLEGNNDGGAGEAVVPILLLEVLGFVRYTDDFEGYKGVSIGASVLNVDMDAVSAALQLHYASLHAGISYGVSDQIKDDMLLFVTFDITDSVDDSALKKKLRLPLTLLGK